MISLRSPLIRSFCSTVFQRSFHVSKHSLASNAGTTTSDLQATTLDKIRNIGIIAHIDAGKTTTTERMLYYSGLTGRIGNVDEGDTVTDYLTQEKDRGITIQSAAVTIPWNNHKINLIDTPGHADFTFEVIRSLRVLDGAVTILDAVAGVEAQTEKVWKQAKDLDIPIIAYINKMDREGAGFGRTVKEIVARLGTRVILVNVPYFIKDPSTQQMVFEGVIDVLNKKLLLWSNENGDNEDGRKVNVIDINDPKKYPELYEECMNCREAAVEQLGEFDEEVINSFFETEDYMEVPADVIKNALRKASIAGYAVPILCGSSFKNIGVQPLLEAVNDYLPSPININPPEITSSSLIQSSKKKSKKSPKRKASAASANQDSHLPVVIDPKAGCIVNKNKNLTTALAFKVITHPNRGIMVFVRVYSGKLQPSSTLFNSRTGEKIKIGKLLLMHGDIPQEVKSLTAGNIGVITGTDKITTGDTLIAHALSKSPNQLSKQESSAKLLPIDIPPPVFSVSIEPNTVADKRLLDSSLEIILREDPSLKLGYDEETGQTILSGMGELHLEITKDRLITDMKVNAEIGEIRVTYKETITAPTTDIEKTIESDSGSYSVSLSLDSFEGSLDETELVNEPGAYVLEQDDNIVIFEKDSTPEVVTKALESETYSLKVSYDSLLSGIISGINGSLQIGGKIAKLPLHSVVIRVKKWSVPAEVSSVSNLLQASRLAVNEALESLGETSSTIMEPIMKVSVFVNDEDLGVVTQDLMNARNARINSIDEEGGSNSGDLLIWSKEQSEKTYVPHDPTIQYMKLGKSAGKKVISAEAPLKEMIGYLPRLRSITQGRGVYDMEYLGMQRTTHERLRQIIGT